MAGTWVTNIQHFFCDSIDIPLPDLPRPALRLLHYFLTIIEDVTMRDDPTVPEATNVRCRRRPGRKPCTGFIVAAVQKNNDLIIHWECPVCSDRGILYGWRWTDWDHSDDEDI